MSIHQNERKKCKFILLFTILLILLILFIGSLWISRYALSITYITTSTTNTTNITSSLRIVQLTDLHNSTFGEGNTQLVEKVEQQSPDLILLTGDLVDSGEENVQVAMDLIKNLSKIAPVYCSNGNHEVEYQQNYGIDLTSYYQQAGATVLEREYQDIEIDGQQLRIGGIYGYCLPTKYIGEARQDETEFLTEFQDTDRMTILLCHMPVCWMINDGLDEWDVDYIFAGHAHGGQVILPVIGGVYAPDMGWFPGRLEGVFQSKDHNSTLILSRGLGTTEKIPRFNNKPEIIVADIIGV